MKEKDTEKMKRYAYLMNYEASAYNKFLKEYEILNPNQTTDDDDEFNKDIINSFSKDDLLNEDEPEIKDKIEKNKESKKEKPNFDNTNKKNDSPKSDIITPVPDNQPNTSLATPLEDVTDAKIDELKGSLLDMLSKVDNIMNYVSNVNDKVDMFNNKVSKLEITMDSMREPTEQEKFDRTKKVSGIFNTRVGEYFNQDTFNPENLETKVSDIKYKYGDNEIKDSFRVS